MRYKGGRVGAWLAAFALSAALAGSSGPAYANGCGDGIVSPTEDCDPAFPESDNCCDPGTCLWTPLNNPDPQAVCSGAPVCQYDVCDGAGGCATGNVTAGTTCNDGDPCTDQTECDGAGACGGGVNLCGDAGVLDAAVEDAGLPDAAGEDAGPPDAAIADAGPLDAALQDGGPPDAASRDGALQDSGPWDVVWFCDVRPDVDWQQDGAPGVDADHGSDGQGRGGCSCRAVPGSKEVPSGDLLLIVVLLGLVGAFRRRYGR
jgi:MYXO-CTERM domain-containing protein